jgi:hypothetical protein
MVTIDADTHDVVERFTVVPDGHGVGRRAAGPAGAVFDLAP